MKKFIIVTIGCLLAVGLFTSVTQAKSPNQLLQDGLYAEETEGDLEKAIGIYEKVIEETAVHQQTAVKATYHWGMCYMKKGDKKKAAEYFQKVKSNYPAQKMLAKKANRQLQKVSSREDILARSYVIHYMAVDQSKNGLELLNKNHPRGVRTHHAGRYRENGKRINSICTDNEEGKNKIVAAIKASDELKLVKVVPPVGQTKTAEDLTAEGWTLLRQRKFGEGEEKFKNAIAKDSKAENAYHGLGWAQLNQGHAG